MGGVGCGQVSPLSRPVASAGAPPGAAGFRPEAAMREREPQPGPGGDARSFPRVACGLSAVAALPRVRCVAAAHP